MALAGASMVNASAPSSDFKSKWKMFEEGPASSVPQSSQRATHQRDRVGHIGAGNKYQDLPFDLQIKKPVVEGSLDQIIKKHDHHTAQDVLVHVKNNVKRQLEGQKPVAPIAAHVEPVGVLLKAISDLSPEAQLQLLEMLQTELAMRLARSVK